MTISPSSKSFLDPSCGPESANYERSKVFRMGFSPLRKDRVRRKLERGTPLKPKQHWKSPFITTDPNTPDHKI